MDQGERNGTFLFGSGSLSTPPTWASLLRMNPQTRVLSSRARSPTYGLRLKGQRVPSSGPARVTSG